MPLFLEEVREKFADFLKSDPNAKWRMDAALVHVVTFAYQRGFEDGVSSKEGGPVTPTNP